MGTHQVWEETEAETRVVCCVAGRAGACAQSAANVG